MSKLTVFWCFLYVLYAIEAASIDYSATKEWNLFKTEFSKSYDSPEEEKFRSKVFMENKRIIDLHNEKFRKGEVTYEMGLNDFSDWSDEEFVKMTNFYKPNLKNLMDSKNDTIFFEAPSGFTAPSRIDWTEKGAVTKVKDQGLCGSCWAFSSTGAVEGQHFIKNGQLLSLSEQNLLDCASGGCSGGWLDDAFDYVKNYGITTADSYPYKAKKRECKRNREHTTDVKIKGYKSIRGGEEELKKAVATIGPISVGFKCKSSFHHYSGGIYYEPNCKYSKSHHAVLVVGYGTENGKDYWLVKNSWSRGWGMHGYVKMARNRNNNCGIASYAVYPVV